MRFISLLILLFCVSVLGKHNSESYFDDMFSSEKIQDIFENKYESKYESKYKSKYVGKYVIYNDARLF